MRTRTTLAALAAMIVTGTTWAQQSASYHAGEGVLNSGGHPAGGAFLASAGFHVTLDALGESVAAARPTSASFHVDGGFVAAYPPPLEVHGLAFATNTTMTWQPERSVGSYDVYRDVITTLPTLSYGSCHLQGLPDTTATVSDSPAPAACWFYLVTARNRLGETGTKGTRSSGAERENPAPCP